MLVLNETTYAKHKAHQQVYNGHAKASKEHCHRRIVNNVIFQHDYYCELMFSFFRLKCFECRHSNSNKKEENINNKTRIDNGDIFPFYCARGWLSNVDIYNARGKKKKKKSPQ